jgi:hypothetical protein
MLHTENFAAELAPLSGEFRTATDVNHALGRLFTLLAENRIPRRNAVALGYLAQLLLQTLPAVREELTDCLGYEAWEETLQSVFPEHQTEDETEDETETAAEAEAGNQDKAEDNREASLSQSNHTAVASEPQPPIEEIKEKEAAHAETKDPPAEIAPAPKPEELPEPQVFAHRMSKNWNYWEEPEVIERLRKMRL